MSASAETLRIERELQETRHRLDLSLSEMQSRLSPGRMIDEAMVYAREAGVGDFGRNLGRSVRNNPLPVALVGVGLAWLMAADRRGGALVHGTTSGGTAEDLAGRARAAAAALTRRAGETQDAFDQRVDDAKAGILGLKRGAEDTVSGFRARVEEGLREASLRYGRMRDQASDMRDQATETLRDGSRRAGDAASQALGQLQDQPMLMAALGVSLGAALGALLPPTQTEDDLMGEAGDALREQAAAGAGEAMSAAGRVAEEAADATREAVRDEVQTRTDDAHEPAPLSPGNRPAA
jgi:hypothetical protein